MVPPHLTIRLPGILENAELSLSSSGLLLRIMELKQEWDKRNRRIEAANAELQRIVKRGYLSPHNGNRWLWTFVLNGFGDHDRLAA
jgi:hypothetical protein